MQSLVTTMADEMKRIEEELARIEQHQARQVTTKGAWKGAAVFVMAFTALAVARAYGFW